MGVMSRRSVTGMMVAHLLLLLVRMLIIMRISEKAWKSVRRQGNSLLQHGKLGCVIAHKFDSYSVCQTRQNHTQEGFQQSPNCNAGSTKALLRCA